MASILVVCTGNVCRSPAAEGFLRRALRDRLGSGAPEVASAGTAGWEGSGATAESVRASAEHGVDTSGHVARILTVDQIRSADLIVAMAEEHTDAVVRLAPDAERRTFTLKSLVRLLEAEPGAPAGLDAVGRAAERRHDGFTGDPYDEDVADPLGRGMQAYRDMAWDLEEWTERLATVLYGPAPAATVGGGAS
jgi:protein-tyrosine phosphatase